MNLSKIVWLLFFIISFSHSSSFADTDIQMNHYFNNDMNMQKYNAAVSSGLIKKQKESINMACEKEKDTQLDLDCGCVKEQLAKASDKEFYYSSIMAYKNYQDQVQALNDGDKEKYERLRKNEAQQDGLTQRMEKACKLK